MKAGRELDALVAEKVMGWVRHPNLAYHQWCMPLENGEVRPLNWLSCHYECDGFGHDSLRFKPSTDISSAWEVVARMDVRGEGAEFSVTRHSTGYFARYLDPGYRQFMDRDFGHEAPTAPLAICLCALQAVGVPSSGSPPK